MGMKIQGQKKVTHLGKISAHLRSDHDVLGIVFHRFSLAVGRCASLFPFPLQKFQSNVVYLFIGRNEMGN